MAATDPLAVVRREWLRRVEAEYGSAALTQHLTLWLVQIAAPLELIRMGLAIVEDELAHSELSQQVYAGAGGSDAARLVRAELGLRNNPGEPLELAVTRAALDTFCLGETVAVRLFSRLRDGCEEPVALAALDRILRDEVKHREFGWTSFEWLASTPFAGSVLALAQAELPRMFARLRTSYAFASLGQRADFAPELRRWGLMPTPEYAATLLETLERDFVPRFADFGIDARAAWETPHS